ncbi:MAG: lipid-A-disaccharide synthase [Ignavibacteriaceae bacterium]
MNKNGKLLVIAGEVSGDLMGAGLISELKRRIPELEIYGIGGDKMTSAGMNIIYHINDLAFLGFAEVVKHLPFIRKVQKKILRFTESENISLAVLIDYPGFNLSIASKLHKSGVKIVYYVSPQLWAWGEGRIKKIKKFIDKMLVVFPFEEKLYKDNNIDVTFVGHPLPGRIKDYSFIDKRQFFEKFNIPEEKRILLILPGSREHEVEHILPVSINAAALIADEFNMQIIVAGSPNIDEKLYFKLSGHKNFRVVYNHNFELMKYADLGIIKSGTSTLEAGLIGLPMVIVYRTSTLTYLIGKSLVKLNNIGMVNIVLGKLAVPELIQAQLTVVNLYNKCREILSDEILKNNIKNDLRNLKEKLQGDNASGKAADIIAEMIYAF